MDLTSMCRIVNNYFVKEKVSGMFELIPNVAPISLIENQYFRIVGSIMNDGVYQNNAESLATLTAEEFQGEIWSMAVPRDFLALCEEIEAFNTKMNEIASKDNGFTSENFDGYSYSKASSLSPALQQEWSNINSRLNNYRRIGVR